MQEQSEFFLAGCHWRLARQCGPGGISIPVASWFASIETIPTPTFSPPASAKTNAADRHAAKQNQTSDRTAGRIHQWHPPQPLECLPVPPLVRLVARRQLRVM